MGLTVIGIGGNALLDMHDPSLPHQFERAAETMAPIAELIVSGEQVVLVHGNGPQVGFMQFRSVAASRELHEVPLFALVADTQGAMGYMLQRCLRQQIAVRGGTNRVATVVTEVEVEPLPEDAEPTKPIGRFFFNDIAEKRMREHGWKMVEDSGRGWRRVVQSPKPRKIIQLETIKLLVNNGVSVIAGGGGGIPVPPGDVAGPPWGIEGVIDKDHTAVMLAAALGAERVVITTSVGAVYENFLGAPEERRRLDRVSCDEMRALLVAGEFPPGSMGPKVEAALQFLENGGEHFVICRPEVVLEAIRGDAGTTIYREKS